MTGRGGERAGTALTIKVESQPNGTTFIFTNRQGRELPVQVEMTIQQLPAIWSDFFEGLTEFKNSIGGILDPTPKQAWNAARILNDAGQTALGEIFGGHTADIIDFCREALALAERPTADFHVGLTETLPFEFLPLLDAGNLPDVRDPADVMSVLATYRRFLGFAATTRRVFENQEQSQDSRLMASPVLPVCLYRHYGLDLSGQESGFFEERQDQIRLLKTWPEDALPPAAAREFCSYFYDVGGEYQIHHFSCHYETDDKQPMNSWFTLSDKAKKSLEIKLKAMVREFVALQSEGRKPNAKTSMPMVFFNACGAGYMNPTAVMLPGQLLRWQYRAFIGPATKVPDQAASMLARYFYSALLDGQSAGEALFSARQNLLVNHLNPLGLLYTLYGNADLAIEREIEREKEKEKKVGRGDET